jgi:cytochrome d ubiquinol oxidase subunit II
VAGRRRARVAAFILVGAAIVLPTMFAFSAYSYWVFRGKARALSYQR